MNRSNSPLLLMITCACFCCAPKPKETLVPQKSQDTLFLVSEFDTAYNELRDLADVREAKAILAIEEPIAARLPALHESLEQLQDNSTFEARINNNKDTTIRLPEGTVLSIPARSFQIQDGGPGLVDIHVNEYYSLVDIFSANLTTTTSEDILETGGMIFIGAFENGRECNLAYGKQIEIHFPFKDKVDGMELFNGKRDSLNNIIWEQASIDMGGDSYAIYEVAERMPEFPGGYQAMIKYLNEKLRYPKDARRLGIEGIVYVKFTVDRWGNVINPAVLRGVHKSIDKAALDVVATMPRWEWPGGYVENANVLKTIPIRFSLGGNNVSSDPYMDKQVKALEENISDSTLKKEDVATISYYILKSAQLGWINCDRFIGAKERITVKVRSQDTASNDLDVKMIFKNIRSVIPGTRVGKSYQFLNIPINEEVFILALRSGNDGLEMSNVAVTTRPGNNNHLLSFKPITVSELKEWLNSFDIR